MSPIITQVAPVGGSHKQFSVQDRTTETMLSILGEPNVADDEFKVKHSWCVTDGERRLEVWDWKGSEEYGAWSCYGSRELAEELFGAEFVI